MRQEKTKFGHAVAVIEHIPVQGFSSAQSLFERIVIETRKPGQSVVTYLNVHVANMACQSKALKTALQQSDIVYCDGAGIMVASELLGSPLPTRLTAADWFMDLLGYISQHNLKVYLLGGAPGVPEKALQRIQQTIPHHTVVGVHHGYIHEDAALEQAVIDEINALEADIVIVGFGTPIQELWIERNRSRLNVSCLYAVGAVMDFVTQTASRCPQWMGDSGLEWLYRLSCEPKRLFMRYVVGNPWFLSRIAAQAIVYSVADMFQKPGGISVATSAKI